MQERVLLDKEIDRVGRHLVRLVPWIENCYGRAERRKTVAIEEDGYVVDNSNPRKTYYYPAVYVRDGEYLNLMPSDKRRNMCFFRVDGAQTIGGEGRSFVVKANMSVIFWVNLRDLYGDEDYHWTENVKYDVLSALKSCRDVRMTAVYEDMEEVWDGYTTRDCIDFMMSPWYGLRVTFELKSEQTCRRIPRPEPEPKHGSFNEDFNEDFDK